MTINFFHTLSNISYANHFIIVRMRQEILIFDIKY